MPFYKKGGFKFKRKSSYLKKLYKKKRTQYRNRQQLLSVKTVKNIAKKVAMKVQETKYFSVTSYYQNGDPNIHLGHPGLYTTNTAIGGHPWVLQIFSNSSITRGVGATQRIGDRINLKGFRIKVNVCSPPNASVNRLGMNWYTFHWMLVKGQRGINLGQQLANDIVGNVWEDQVLLNRDKTRPKIKIVKKGKYTFRPKIWINAISPGLPQGTDIPHPRPQAQLPTSCSTLHSKFFNLYIPINKVYNMADSSVTLQPDPYFLVLYSTQQRQKVGVDGYYVGEVSDGGMSALDGNLQYNVRVDGLKMQVLFSD